MAQQTAIAAKTAITALSLTGTALSIGPRGRDAKNNLNWVAAGSTNLDDILLDFSYHNPTAARRNTRGNLRTFVPKTVIDSTTGLTSKVGEGVFNLSYKLDEILTAADRQKVLDIFTSAICAPEFRDAFINGNVMY